VAFRADDGLDALARRCTDRPPDVEFTAPDGVTHAVWITERPGDIADICAAVRRLDRLYITDGHHRFAAASRVAAAGRRAGHGPDAADQWLLACLFAHDDLRILPFHRTVPRPPGATGGELLATLRRHVRVRPLAGPQPPAAPHTFSAYLDGAWYALSVPSAAVGADPLGQLDVVALQDAVLAPVFGVVEPRRDPRLGYIAGDVTTLAAHCARSARMGFALRPTGMEELMAVAEAGHAMPPKSTRFDPKTRAGIFVRLLR
jgi:uncharacterized protein (DUF1015 family)